MKATRECGDRELAAIRFAEAHPERVKQLQDNAAYFRAAIQEAGFNPLPGETPIIPIIVGDTSLAIRMSEMMLAEGVFVTGFGFPVVPQGVSSESCTRNPNKKLLFKLECMLRRQVYM